MSSVPPPVRWLVVVVVQVFRSRTPPEAIQLVSRLLEYTPVARISPLEACAHPFFDELREASIRLPNGRELPPLFNFTPQGESAQIFGHRVAVLHLSTQVLFIFFL